MDKITEKIKQYVQEWVFDSYDVNGIEDAYNKYPDNRRQYRNEKSTVQEIIKAVEETVAKLVDDLDFRDLYKMARDSDLWLDLTMTPIDLYDATKTFEEWFKSYLVEYFIEEIVQSE